MNPNPKAIPNIVFITKCKYAKKTPTKTLGITTIAILKNLPKSYDAV